MRNSTTVRTSRTLNADPDEILDGFDALLVARDVAETRWGSRKLSIEDREDAIQDALLSVWSSHVDGRVNGLTPGLINNAIGFAAIKIDTKNTGVKAADLKARATLAGAIRVDEDLKGRPLTGKEKDVLAAKIRKAAPAGRRPSENFRNTELIVDSLDDPDSQIACEAHQVAAPDMFEPTDWPINTELRATARRRREQVRTAA